MISFGEQESNSSNTFDMKCVTKAKNVMNAKDKSCRLKVRTPPGHKGYSGDTPRLR